MRSPHIGTGDFRVPITQSFQLYHGLVDNGVLAQFIAFPESGHNPRDHERRDHKERSL